jgi:hypothetical protein
MRKYAQCLCIHFVTLGTRDVSLFHNVQTGPGAQPASYPMGIGSIFPGIKRPKCEADRSPSCSAEVRNEW